MKRRGCAIKIDGVEYISKFWYVAW